MIRKINDNIDHSYIVIILCKNLTQLKDSGKKLY